MKLFTNVAGKRPKRTAFDLSHERKLSCKVGELVPILLDEVVPGDTFTVNSELLIRLAPLLAPVMHRVNAYVHYFYVPNRIIWEDWQDFITNNDTDLLLPQLTNSTDKILQGSLYDHLGLPINVTCEDIGGVSALPVRAYHKIWNEYYRDQNLEAEIDVETIQAGSLYNTIQTRAWEKDYFTSSLPWRQKTPSGQGVGIPVNPNYIATGSLATNTDDTAAATGTMQIGAGGQITDGVENVIVKNLVDGEELSIDINEFRQANRLQQWFERQARAGSRYVETLLSHFGEKIPDKLYRPEFLGGGKTPVQISAVYNTNGNQQSSATSANTPLGDMGGNGLAVGRMNRAKAKFQEHGWLVGILSVIPKTTYQQGVHRSWLRDDPFEFYWPEFANLGEQAVLNKELAVVPGIDNPTWNHKVFGYQSVYSELKYKSSQVSGDFRTDLNYWHMGRVFDLETPQDEQTLPALNADFIQCDHTEVSRVFAVPTDEDPNKPYSGKDHLWVQVYNEVTAVRPMPYHGTPRL